ncbi:MAG: hypothetical protein ACRELX_03715 [Longimicrobiales bacterium]
MKPRRTEIGDPADTWVETYEAEAGEFTTLVSRVVGTERVRLERHRYPTLEEAMALHDELVARLRGSST